MKRKCKICGDRFETPYLNRCWCSDDCLKEYKQLQYEKAREKAKSKPQKPIKVRAAIKSQSDNKRAVLMRELTRLFNAYIRRRDEHQPCISCGTTQSDAWHAGHYKTAKAYPELRFDENNVHKQCFHCNVNLSGNIEGYRKGLLQRIGKVALDELESHTPQEKLSLAEIKELIVYYESQQ